MIRFNTKFIRNIYELILILTIVFCLTMLNGCEKDYDLINDTDIFNQQEEKYFVFFIKDDCPYCESISSDVKDYIEKASKDSDLTKLYVVNINNGTKSLINRSYSGSDAQGADKDYYVNGVSVYSDLYIPGTPSLIYVYTNNNQKVSRYITEGKTSVKNTLLGLLNNGITEEYKVKYDLNYDVDNKNYEEIYYSWQEKITLNVPVREGYTFIGWEENSILIDDTDLEKRNYDLKAVWSSNEYTYINDSEIFLQDENSYLVYFMKDECSYCNAIKEDVIKYLYKINTEIYKESKKIYIVNLSYNDSASIIYREYANADAQGSNGKTYVDGVNKYDDLYISATPTLIKVDEKDEIKTSYFLASGSTDIKEALEYQLIKNGEKVDETKYKIEFDLGYDNLSMEPIEYYKWQTISKLPTPTRSEYVFNGWKLDDSVVSVIYDKDAKLVAQWISKEYYREIDDTEIFNQKENKYLVYFMKDGCTYCNKIKADVDDYITKSLSEEYKNSLKLYVVNLNDTDGKGRSIILRSYTGENGDGDGDTFVSGAQSWDQLYVPSTPTLISITFENNKNVVKLEGIGSTNVKNILQSNLVKGGTSVGERNKFSIEFDLMDDNLEKLENKEFYNGSTIELPTPIREGYIFVGWEYNGNIITDVQYQNYKLNAKWVSINDGITISIEDLLIKDGKYYVIFVSEKMTKYTEIMQMVIEYQYKSQNNDLFICYSKNTVIDERYLGNDGEGYNKTFYVSKANSYEELRIPFTPCLISFDNTDERKSEILGTFSSEVIKALKAIIEK